jgi:hypothetical protein
MTLRYAHIFSLVVITVELLSDVFSNWVVIAHLGAGMDAHGDAGLDAATQYFLG